MIPLRKLVQRAPLFALVLFGVETILQAATDRPPNILFAISDDQSWIHAGAYGTAGVRTPAFDRVAREGVLFEQAFCVTPSCAPSRASILTGQHTWRLKSAGSLLAVFPAEWPVFPHLLEDTGYVVGYTGKGWGPGRLEGWNRHPIGTPWQQRKLATPKNGMSNIDYAGNFQDFLAARPKDRPFFFWFGASEPHLPYDRGVGVRSGARLEDAKLFSYWPDNDVFRGDVLDYGIEIEHFDHHLQRMLEELEAIGELDNTIVIVTSDHGNPLARSKCNLYDGGTRVPLAVRLPGTIPGGRTVTDLASLADIAPTLLELVGIETPAVMSGRSLMPVLKSRRSGRVDPSRDFVVTAFERHTWCRPGGVGYPARAIRTDDFLYIRNYEPSRWPAGDPDFDAAPQGFAGDIDDSPSKRLLLDRRDHPDVAEYWQLAIGRRPAEELYRLADDPDQITNLADDPAMTETREQLATRLDWFLRVTNDPRQRGEAPWDDYEYTAGPPPAEAALRD